MGEESGRSGAGAPSGCQSAASAANASSRSGIPNAGALRERMIAEAGGEELVELLPCISAWSERRPARSEGERAEIADKFSAHLPISGTIRVISERDMNAMRAAFIRRFNEDLPRTETLFAVAAIGYRMALRDAAQGIEARSGATACGRDPEGESPVAESDAPK